MWTTPLLVHNLVTFLLILPMQSMYLLKLWILFKYGLEEVWFDAYELGGTAEFLGSFCLSLFILIVVFVCMNIFLIIIYQSFRRAWENVNNDEEIFSFMWNKFQHWTGLYFLWIIGLKKLNKLELHPIQDAQIRSQYMNPIEALPNKIDQLLDALNQVCLFHFIEKVYIFIYLGLYDSKNWKNTT